MTMGESKSTFERVFVNCIWQRSFSTTMLFCYYCPKSHFFLFDRIGWSPSPLPPDWIKVNTEGASKPRGFWFGRFTVNLPPFTVLCASTLPGKGIVQFMPLLVSIIFQTGRKGLSPITNL